MYEGITRYINVFDDWANVERPNRVVSDFLGNLESIADHGYVDTLERFGLEWSAGSMAGADLTDAPAELAIALLTGAYRADHFCNGILEREFIPNGLVSRCLRRLRELDARGRHDDKQEVSW